MTGSVRNIGNDGAVAGTVIAGMSTRRARGQGALSLARDQLRTGHTDSALVVPWALTDSPTGRPAGQVVEAWILTGVARFYSVEDTEAAEAFRRAFALDPGVRADGLASMDSSLGAVFEAQRPIGTTAAANLLASVAGKDSLGDCRGGCPKAFSKPVLAYFHRCGLGGPGKSANFKQ